MLLRTFLLRPKLSLSHKQQETPIHIASLTRTGSCTRTPTRTFPTQFFFPGGILQIGVTASAPRSNLPQIIFFLFIHEKLRSWLPLTWGKFNKDFLLSRYQLEKPALEFGEAMN